MIIRAETGADHDDIRRINDEAFGEPVDRRRRRTARSTSGRYAPSTRP